MARASRARGGRTPRHGTQRLSKNRTFRIVPSLDRAMLEAAQQSGRSVSEEIERHLTRSLDSAALLRLLLGSRAPKAEHLLGLVASVMLMRSFADWADDAQQREAFKTVVTTLIDAVARGELTIEQMNEAPGQSEHKLAAYVVYNPHKPHPASAAIYRLAPRK